MRNGLFLLFVFVTAAHATQASQTFVSASGSDSNPCTQASPCATFQAAINATAPGGEVDALSAGNFGLFTISQAITIDGRALGSVGTNATTVAISVGAGSTDTVVLRNLSINGGGKPNTGIQYDAGGMLFIDGCSISGFSQPIQEAATNASLFLRNTTIVGGLYGIHIAFVPGPGGTLTLEHVSIAGFTNFGIEVDSGSSTTITDSVITGGQYGVSINPETGAGTMIERSTITGASVAGAYIASGVTSIDSSTFLGNNVAIEAGGGTIRLSNNNIYNNQTGLACPSGTINSEGNNRKGSNTGGSAAVCAVIGSVTLQ